MCDPNTIQGLECLFDTIQKDPQILLAMVILFFAFVGFVIVAGFIGDFVFLLLKRIRRVIHPHEFEDG